MKSKIRFNKAAVDGLILGAITIVLALLKEVLPQIAILNFIIWFVKLGATMFVLWYFMKKNCELNTIENLTTTYSDSFKYGFIVSIFSVLIIALYSYITIQFSDPSVYAEQLEEQMGAMSQDQLTMVDWIMDHRGAFTIWAIIITYGIWSAIASAILAGSTKSKDPFRDQQYLNQSN